MTLLGTPSYTIHVSSNIWKIMMESLLSWRCWISQLLL